MTFNFNNSFPYTGGTLTPVGTSVTVSWGVQGSSVKISAASTTGTLLVWFAGPKDGGRYIVKTIGLTSRVWSFTGSGGNVKWAGGVAPTVSAVSNQKDMFEFYYDANDSTYIGKVVAQNVS